MVRMQSNQNNRTLPDEIIDGTAHSAVSAGFYVHGGCGMDGVDPNAAHVLSMRYVKPKNYDKVHGIGRCIGALQNSVGN